MRQGTDYFREAGHVGAVPDGRRIVLGAERDVLENGCREDLRILRYKRDRSAYAFESVLDAIAIHEQFEALGVMEVADNLQKRGFATAGFSDKRDTFTAHH